MTPRATASALLSIALLAVAPGASAATFCVASAAELTDALDTAAANGLDDEIRIVSGSYGTSSGFSYQTASGIADNLTISGGWVPGCNRGGSRAHLTTLDGLDTITPVLVLVSDGGEFVVRNLSIVGAFSFHPAEAALHVGHLGGTGPDVRIERVILRDNETSQALYVGTGGTIELLGSLVADNVVLGIGAGAELVQEGTAVTHVVADTFSSNQATVAGGLGGLRFDNGTQTTVTHVVNDIFWQNELADVEVIGEVSDFSFNDFGVLLGATTGSNNLQVDPLFVDPAGFDFSLPLDSPLIDNGSNFATENPGHDLLGVQRPQNLVYDRGAYELPLVFADGFESGDASAWSAAVP